MSGWDFKDFRRQVVQTKERYEVMSGRRRGKGDLCCFAKTADDAYRFRSRHDEPRIKVEARYPGFRAGWVTRGWVMADEVMRAEVLLPQHPRRHTLWKWKPLTADELAAVAVARDQWLEAGGGRMKRAFIVGTAPAADPDMPEEP